MANVPRALHGPPPRKSPVNRAGKGRWTGPSEVLDDGTRTVSGRFKMPNGWTFDDYDRTRRLVADAIAELDRLAKTPPAR